MIKVIFEKMNSNLPVKVWADDIEDGAMEQIINMSKLPFAFRHIAIMPDCHQGYGVCIGGILATKDYIIPNAVGVDISCGMRAVKTNMQYVNPDYLKKAMQKIREEIPVGFKHNEESNYDKMPKFTFENSVTDMPIIKREFESASKQIGSLGGGNHFLEIQRDTNGFVWIMIHSGSRNLGYKVAKYYNDIAISLNEKWQSIVPLKWELAFLPVNSEEGQSYLREMNYCVEFAKASRGLMMSKIKDIIDKELSITEFGEDIDVTHNYVRLENHFGQNIWVHRKGAISARLGEIGIIPGSQGTKSYVVKGLGNKESFESASHGAGRKMSRSEARKTLNLEDEKKLLNDKGIIHAIRHEADLDEAPSAYKDIENIMENQKDLVEIIEELTPLAVIKG